MTVLTAIDQASRLMGKGVVTLVFASASPFATEMAALANEAAADMAKGYDWRRLTVLHTVTGDGSTNDFPLPDDYDRLPVKMDVMRGADGRTLQHVDDLDTWNYRRATNLTPNDGEWTILGGQLSIYPAIASGETVRFYYVSNEFAQETGGGDKKAAFTADTDVFLLSERLLTLALIWRWRAMKGYEYAEDMQSYEIALAQEIVRERGPRILTTGRRGLPPGASYAYPRQLG